MFVTSLFWGTIDFHSRRKNTMEVNGAPELLCFPHSSEYLPLCSAEQRNSYRFGTTWGWVNDDRIFIFGWTIPLSHFHFIRPFFKHLYYFKFIDFIYLFIYSFIHLFIIDRATGSINECQRSLFLWSEFLHFTVTPCIRAHKTTWRLEWPCFSKWRLAWPQCFTEVQGKRVIG